MADLRSTNIDKLRSQSFDVCVVGGGINGAVSAAALAAQGASVALIDRGDFAGATSSQSSNLAWGGIKYLETWEFPLVWGLCASRNRLTRNYPSTVKEVRFLTTIESGFRFPAFAVYLGALLYWAMGRFKTRAPRYLSRRQLKAREPLVKIDDASAAVEYSDCYLHDNDARFVFSFVRSAMDYGAIAANYVGSSGAEHDGDNWSIAATDENSGDSFTVQAKALINACGPWVDGFNERCGISTQHRHVFSKGVHLIVDRVAPERRILAFFASDGRLFFVIPMGPRTCIGTTDTRVESPPGEIAQDDRAFIIANANQMLNLDQPLTEADIIAERCGVRPLVLTGRDDTSDWLALSREHVIEADAVKRHLSIFGGKLTDCLNIGESVADQVESMGVPLPARGFRWYGEPRKDLKKQFFHQADLMGLDDMTDPRSCEPLSKRFWRRYGASAFEMLETIRKDPSSAERMIQSAEYLRCEIEQTGRREMITKLEDFLRRRSKISQVLPRDAYIDAPGLREACRVFFGDQAEERLAEYLEGLD